MFSLGYVRIKVDIVEAGPLMKMYTRSGKRNSKTLGTLYFKMGPNYYYRCESLPRTGGITNGAIHPFLCLV